MRSRRREPDLSLAPRERRRPPVEERTAVIDLGSNSFRLVVFTAAPGRWWKRTDEIHDPVRIGAGLDAGGSLQPKPMRRALETLEAYAHFCRATGLDRSDVEAVATSAIRDAANREQFLADAAASGIAIRVLAGEEEARYGYLAAVNSTTLADGVVLDLGGGSVQLVRVRAREAVDLDSWPLGAVRMTERFLAGDADAPTGAKALKALRAHVREQLAGAPWLHTGERRIVGIGGTVRNLAAAAGHLAGQPDFGVQGFQLTRAALDDLVERLAALPPAERGAVDGIKPARGDVILAGAAVIQTILELGEFEELEVTEAGLREGIFFERLLAPADPPLFADVREASIRNLAGQYDADIAHAEHVATLALAVFDGLAQAGVHPGDPGERERLRAAAMLHDIGVAVDYDDHHKHTRYLILNAGLPGFSRREVAVIAQAARYHRKGNPGFGFLAPLTRPKDEAELRRSAALLRLAEQLERSRDQLVRSLDVDVSKRAVTLSLHANGDLGVARWGAERQAGVFAEAFGRELEIAP